MTSKVRLDARMRKPILEELFSAESMVSYRLRSRLTSSHSRNKGLSMNLRENTCTYVEKLWLYSTFLLGIFLLDATGLRLDRTVTANG